MAQAIETPFDNPLSEDVTLEEVDTSDISTTLKNAENVYKSFLYMRKMYSMFPTKENITVINTIDETDFVVIDVPEMSNYIVINNIGTTDVSIRINGGEYTLIGGQKETFPIIAPDTSVTPNVSGDTVELKGTCSYVIKNVQDF